MNSMTTNSFSFSFETESEMIRDANVSREIKCNGDVVLNVEEGELELRKALKILLTHFSLKKALHQNRSPPNVWVCSSPAITLLTNVIFSSKRLDIFSTTLSCSCPSPYLRKAISMSTSKCHYISTSSL